MKDDTDSYTNLLLIEKEHSEDALKRELFNVKKYLDCVGVLLVALDCDHNVIHINRRGCEILGCEEEEIILKDWFDTAIPKKGRDDAVAAFQKLLTGEMKSVEPSEGIVLTKSGERRIILWQNTAVTDESGNIVGIISSGEDVTERRKMKEGLQRLEDRYTSLFENIVDAVYVVSKSGKILSVNSAFERITGWSREDWVGKHFLPLVHPEDLKSVMEMFKENVPNLTTEETFDITMEVRIVKKDGGCVPVEVKLTPIVEDGKMIGEFGIARDITERKKAEEKLRQSEERYSTLVEMSSSGIVLAHDGKLVFANQRFYDIFDIEESVIKDKNVISVLSGRIREMLSAMSKDDKKMLLKRLLDAAKGLIIPHCYQIPIKMGSGEICWIEVNVRPIEYRGGPAEMVMFTDITESKRSEDKLKELKERFHSLIESSPDIIAQFDSSGKIITANTTLSEFLDLPLEAIIDGNISDVLPEEVLGRGLELLAQIKKSDKPVFFEDYIKGRYYHTVVVPVDTPGEKRTFQMISRDITEHKEAEMEIDAAKKRMEDILESMIDGVTITDMKASIKYVNKAASMQTGYQREELIGRKVQEVYITKEDLPKTFNHLKKLLSGEPLKAEEYSILRKDGSTFPGSLNFSLLMGNEGKVESIIAVHRDITERKYIEDELRRSEERYRLLSDNLKDVIWSMDLNLRINYMSPSAKNVYGINPDEAAGKSMMKILPPESIDIMMESIKGNPDMFKLMMELMTGRIDSDELARRSSILSKPLQYEIMRIDGTRFFAEASMSPFYDSNGKVVGLCGITRDITERKKAEAKLNEVMEDLERSNKELEQFAYVASHDLQEPLRMVSSYMQLLSRRYKGKLDSDADEFIHFAVDGATRMQRMINDLLTYSRVGTRGRPFEETDCEAVIGSALINLEVRVEESGAVVTHDPLPTIMADDVQFVQLLQNLISNAVKYNDKETPTVHLRAEERDGEWLFSVKDNGIGIDPEYKDQVFQIFRRLQTKEEYEGSGIGLSVCRKIVERHGGRIWLESKSGEGTTFYFTIPKKREKDDG
ncbi:MAG: PAS domain S-box protein [Halobacteriota archaeon]|nr:PAS domain S-box protein [Halobacteriota archaeon]